MIISIGNSQTKNKRYQVTMDNGKTYDFGYKGGQTYIDHHDTTKRLNYWQRHIGNKTEEILINNLIPSPSLFSAYLLWGNRKTLKGNINELNHLWYLKHRKIQ